MHSMLLLICIAATILACNAFTPVSISRCSNSLIRQKIPLSRIQPLYADGEDEDYMDDAPTQRQILKEETEAPFRKIRIFLYISLLAAAGLGTLVSLTKVIALTAGAQVAAAGDETYLNLGINLAGIPVLSYFWKRDLDSQKSRLERIQKGGSLAGLKLKYVNSVDDTTTVVKLSALRRDRGIDKRVIIVAAPKELLKSSLASSIGIGSDITQNDLVIVPLSIDTVSPYGDNSIPDGGYSLSSIEVKELLGLTDTTSCEHIWSPVALPNWNKVIKSEMATALKQQPEALMKGITVVIKKNGRVGSRRFGVPLWETLVEDVQIRREMGMDVKNI